MMDDILSRVLRLMLQENAELAVCRRCECGSGIRTPLFRKLSAADLKVIDAAKRKRLARKHAGVFKKPDPPLGIEFPRFLDGVEILVVAGDRPDAILRPKIADRLHEFRGDFRFTVHKVPRDADDVGTKRIHRLHDGLGSPPPHGR